MKRKSTGKARSDIPVGSLIRQPHGGALRYGGTSAGGSGRPPLAIRARSRAMYDRILDVIEARNLAEATLNELSMLGTTVARYGGLASDDEAPESVTIRIVRDPMPDFAKLHAQPALPVEPVADPPLLPPPHGPSKTW